MRIIVFPATICSLLVFGGICPFPAYAQPTVPADNPSTIFSEIAATNDVVFISLDDGIHGAELWKYDPQERMTSLVKDILQGSGSSSPSSFFVWDETLYFAADDGNHGTELWRSDGTALGTQLVSDVNPSRTAPRSSNPQHFGVFENALYFVADDGRRGFELWRTVGDRASTTIVKDVHPPGIDIGTTFAIAPFDGFALFRGATRLGPGELWRTDGTERGTYEIPVPDFHLESVRGEMVRLQNFAIFVATSSESGTELWRSDGTEPGTFMIRDIAEGQANSNPSNLVRFGDTVLFQAASIDCGMEAWVSDGTAQGTRMIKDILDGAGGSDPAPFCVVQDRAFFVADDGVTGRELWVTDGTSEGTKLVDDIMDSGQSSNPYEITAFGDEALFSANSTEYGEELFITEGRGSGARLVKDINPGLANSEPYYITVLNDFAYFEANDGRHGSELWKTDGTNHGTRLVADIAWPAVPPESSHPNKLTAGKDMVYFSARDRDGLWRLRRHLSGIAIETAIAPQLERKDMFRQLLAAPGGIYALTDDSPDSAQLWFWDDASPSPSLIGQAARPDERSPERSLALHNGTLYFAGIGEEVGTELFAVDAGALTATLVADIAEGSAGSNPHGFISVGSDLYFAATDAESGTELWRLSNDRADRVEDIRPGPASSSPRELTSVNSSLFFTANDGVHGCEMWLVDLNSGLCRIVADINPAQDEFAACPVNLVAIQDTLLFAANDGVSGLELWRTDESAHSTQMVKDLFYGPASSNPEQLTLAENLVYFRAESPGKGIELFVTDGTPGGTHMAHDLVPGKGHSYVNWLTSYNGGLAFSARSALHGQTVGLPVPRWTDGLAFHDLPVAGDQGGAHAEELIAIGNTLVFTCDDGEHGRELWKTVWNGKSYFTVLVEDLLPAARLTIAEPSIPDDR